MEVEELPANKAELLMRIAPASDPFDGGHTAAWLSARMRDGTAQWRAVRDRETGHTIHCVTDRQDAAAVEADLRRGLRIMRWLSCGRGSRQITWFWWDQDWPRLLPPDTYPRREHVNGGWATPGIPEVHVYRREEAFRVLIHEAIHALNLDVAHDLTVPVRRQFETALGLRLWPHFGEAYTELFAEWLTVITEATSLADAERRWMRQCSHAGRQAGRIWFLLSRLSSPGKEDTNVFAYYVMKWVLMRNNNHLAESLLTPTHGVEHWWEWFEAAVPALEHLAASVTKDDTEVSMRMTHG